MLNQENVTSCNTISDDRLIDKKIWTEYFLTYATFLTAIITFKMKTKVT